MSKGQFFALAAWHIEGRDAVAIDSVGVKSEDTQERRIDDHYWVSLLCYLVPFVLFQTGLNRCR